MKHFVVICFLLLGSIFVHAQDKSSSLTGLDAIMKEKVGAPFKIVFTHIMKQGQIDPAGSTLAATLQARDGLMEASTKAPSQLLNSAGQLKDAESAEIFKGYQLGIQAMIVEVTKLVDILSAKTDDAQKIEAAKVQLQMIMRFQKKAHDNFKDE